jgi:CheY-like chemotaxis protein
LEDSRAMSNQLRFRHDISIFCRVHQPALLIVDDDPLNRRVAGAVLAHAGWDIDEADGCREALSKVSARRYALILMDIQMPDIDGYETARLIRARGDGGANVPILAFTALQSPDAIEHAFEVGMDGHLPKPFTTATLLAAVDPWRPDGEGPPGARLAAIFGKAEVAALLTQFRCQIADAIAALEGAPDLRAVAHRLAGIAGTLGFPEVSLPWRRLSEGDDTAHDEARRVARKTLARLDHRSDDDNGEGTPAAVQTPDSGDT